MKTIILDVDNVVADFTGHVLSICDKANFLTRREREATVYNWWDKKYPNWINKRIWKEMKNEQSNFWTTLPILHNAFTSVYLLREKYKIKWCTKPFVEKYGWESDRRSWLEKHFQIDKWEEEITFTAEKEDVRGDIIIDDCIEHVVKWQEKNPNKLAILFKNEMNRLHTTPRPKTWNEIIQLLCTTERQY